MMPMNQTQVDTSKENINSSKNFLTKFYPALVVELALSIICSAILISVYIIVSAHRTLPDLLMRNKLPHLSCVIIGIIIHATFLATFFWTNVMAFDIMRTMAALKPNSKGTSKYWKYSIYAWTMTLVCTIPTIIVNYNMHVPNKYKPKFGIKKCWLSGELAFLIYFNAPVGITLAANCFFFFITVRTIIRVRNATIMLDIKKQRKRFKLCVKLVLIMGLIWIIEFIPWITGIYKLYAIAGMLNCLHGVYLFFIFAYKRHLWKQVIEKLQFSKVKKHPIANPSKKQSPSLDTISTTLST